jgi:hypothetical protein
MTTGKNMYQQLEIFVEKIRRTKFTSQNYIHGQRSKHHFYINIHFYSFYLIGTKWNAQHLLR